MLYRPFHFRQETEKRIYSSAHKTNNRQIRLEAPDKRPKPRVPIAHIVAWFIYLDTRRETVARGGGKERSGKGRTDSQHAGGRTSKVTGKGECRTKVRGKPARRQGDLWARTAIDNTASRRFLPLPLCPAQTGGEHAPEHNTVHWHARSTDTPAHAPSGGVAARGTCPEGEKKGGHAAYRTPLCARPSLRPPRCARSY